MNGSASSPHPFLSIIIPAYNEEQRIGATLSSILEYVADHHQTAEILVVDDGSTDSTASVVARVAGTHPVQLIRNGTNRGKGYSVRQGMRHARGEYLLMTDADLSTPIADLDKLLESIRAGADVAIASRALPESDIPVHQPWWREHMGRVFNVAARVAGLTRHHDTQCGFKLLRRADAARLLPLLIVHGFAFDVELLYAAEHAGLSVREVPVTWRHAELSRVDPIWAPVAMLRDLVRVRARAWAAAYEPERADHAGLAPVDRVAIAALLILTVGLRVVRLNQPFVDKWSWRESDVAMIARNFLLHDFRLFWPQIDWFGASGGYVGTEFPLVPGLAALAYRLFGVHEYFGRGISVVASAAAVPLLYSLTASVANRRAAIFATLAFALFPMSVFAGREFMTDMVALCLSLLALVTFRRWLDEPTPPRAASAAASLSLAILVKLPAATIGLPIAYLVWTRRRWQFLRDPRIWTMAFAAWVAPLLWYLHAWRVAVVYEPHHQFGEGGIGFATLHAYGSMLLLFVNLAITPIGALGFVAGLCLISPSRERYLFHWWALAALSFSIVVGVGSRHPWYQLPLLPAAAAGCGVAVDGGLRAGARVGAKGLTMAAAACTLALFAYTGFAAVRPLYVPWGEPLRQAGLEIQHLSPPDARVVFMDDGDPLGIYYSNRLGWHLLPNFGNTPSNDEEAISELERLRRQGAKFLVTTIYTDWWLVFYARFGEHVRAHYPRVAHTDDYAIYDLSPK